MLFNVVLFSAKKIGDLSPGQTLSDICDYLLFDTATVAQ
jgi:hypothetical protein